MHDDMKALQERFYREPEQAELANEIENLHLELASHLDKHDRKVLLRLLDTQSLMREEASLASFAAGFRLAVGLARELSLEEPYSFEREKDRLMIELWNERRDL